MADLIVRREVTPQLQPNLARELSPIRMMRDLLRFDPFLEMAPILSPEAMAFAPAFEVKETPEAYVFKADVPGIKEKDIEVTLTGNRLTLSGKREEEAEEKGETWYSRERTYGSFCRSFTLPEGVDTEHIHADLAAGVLTVAVTKLPEVQPKKIAVKSAKV